MDDRRKFERVRLPDSAKAYVLDGDGSHLGHVRVLGAGGLLLETRREFLEFTLLRGTLIDEDAGICRELPLIARHNTPDGCTGFEFVSLDTAAAVEIGIIIGKYAPDYYSAASGTK